MTTANNDLPRCDVEITDGVTSVGLHATNANPSALRRIPRGKGLEDLEISQSDWTGGRGASVVADDPDKFFDSFSAWTDRGGQITPAPLPSFGIFPNGGANKAVSNWPKRTSANAPYLYTTVTGYLAVKIVIAATYNNPQMFFWAAASGTFEAELRADSAGLPAGVTLATSTLSSQDTGVRMYGAYFASAPAAGSYWLVIKNPGGISLEVVTNADTASTATSSDGVTWSGGTGLGLYYQFGQFSIDRQLGGKFFEYKRGLYYAVNVNNNTILYLNGIRGLANNLSVVGATVLSPGGIANDQYNACVYVVSNGQYSGESRIIEDDQLQDMYLSGSYRHSYASPHEYVIRGDDLWTEKLNIVGGAVTDVAVVGEWVYLARGDSLDVIRYREYNNAGTWTVEAVAEAGVRAELLKVVTRAGKKIIYRVYGGASSLTRQYFGKADVPTAWGTPLAFGADAAVSHDGSPCQAILDFDGTIYLTTESDQYEIHDTGGGEFVAKRPGPSEVSMRDPYNGQAATWWNSNFFHTYQEGFMRVYGRTVDDIGPNRGEGLPSDRRGNITSAAPMFGTMAVSVSQYNTSGQYATVLTTTAPGGSWHELFRAPYPDVWIQSLYYESIPGITNRLWFTMGDHVMYLHMPNNAQNPLNDYQYRPAAIFSGQYQLGMLYAPTAQVQFPWMDFGAPELDHYWSQLRVYNENLGSGPLKPGFGSNAGVGSIKWKATIWPSTEHDLTTITTSPYQFIPIALDGNRIQLKAELRSSNASIPAVLRSYTLLGRQHNQVKYDYQIYFTHDDQMQLDHGGQAQSTSEQVEAILAAIAGWMENATLLTMTSKHKAFDGKTGHIDPVPITAQSWDPARKTITGAVVFREI